MLPRPSTYQGSSDCNRAGLMLLCGMPDTRRKHRLRCNCLCLGKMNTLNRKRPEDDTGQHIGPPLFTAFTQALTQMSFPRDVMTALQLECLTSGGRLPLTSTNLLSFLEDSSRLPLESPRRYRRLGRLDCAVGAKTVE